VDGSGAVHDRLSLAFSRYHARAHATLLRCFTVIILVANLALIPYDDRRASFDSGDKFVVLMLRVVVVVPVCIGITLYTFSPWYNAHPSLLALPALCLGAVVIAYGAIGSDPGYGTLAVLIVYLYW
jgi:hypothetical protein